MDSLFQAVGDFIARNHMWAGVLLGLVTFFESRLCENASSSSELG